jgi:hypothetical protein
MKKLLITSIILVSMNILLKAQDYENSVGLRLGMSNGISLKHFFTTTDAGEAILTARWGGLNLTGLAERHSLAFDTDGLYYYYGGGLHLGTFKNNSWFSDGNNHVLIGIDGILGLEYIFKDLPLNASIDWKPGLNLIGYTGFWWDEGAVSVRYIF